MSLSDKINKLNDLCKGTLSISHYTDWVAYSYGKNTVLCVDKHPNSICATSFEECIDKALKIAQEVTK